VTESDVTRLPPDFDRRLSTDERAAVIASLLGAVAEIDDLAACVDLPESVWPRSIAERVKTSGTPGDTRSAALNRWWLLFAHEAHLVRSLRNKAVHQDRVSDGEIQRAEWLAREVLRIVLRPDDMSR
jgi:hypothetical protein